MMQRAKPCTKKKKSTEMTTKMAIAPQSNRKGASAFPARNNKTLAKRTKRLSLLDEYIRNGHLKKNNNKKARLSSQDSYISFPLFRSNKPCKKTEKLVRHAGEAKKNKT